MSALITIFKNDMQGYEPILSRLRDLSNECRELEDAFVFGLRANQLMTFLSVLNHTHIAYGTHFSHSTAAEEIFQQKPA